jgi:phosphotransferase system enzyme I (PtsP)
MLLDLDIDKAKAAIDPLIDAPAGSVSVRHRIEMFAAGEGLQL